MPQKRRELQATFGHCRCHSLLARHCHLAADRDDQAHYCVKYARFSVGQAAW